VCVTGGAKSSAVIPGVVAAFDHLAARHASAVERKQDLERQHVDLHKHLTSLESQLRSGESEVQLSRDKIAGLEVELKAERQACADAQQERNQALENVSSWVENLASVDTEGLVERMHGQARRGIEEAIGIQVQRGVSQNEAIVQEAMQAMAGKQQHDMEAMLHAAAVKVCIYVGYFMLW
jgi:chromosome segregation ATPase